MVSFVVRSSSSSSKLNWKLKEIIRATTERGKWRTTRRERESDESES